MNFKMLRIIYKEFIINVGAATPAFIFLQKRGQFAKIPYNKSDQTILKECVCKCPQLIISINYLN